MAGSRSFNDYKLLCTVCDFMLQNQNESNIEIVSGHAKGCDLLGEKYAADRGYKLTIFPADWSLGKQGGYIRNKQMSEYADALIAFMEKGGTKGTQHMIDIAKEKGLKVKVILF